MKNRQRQEFENQSIESFDSHRLIRYALLTLILFMLICSVLAIIFVMIFMQIDDHRQQQQQYSDGKQGKRFIIHFNYIVDVRHFWFIASWRIYAQPTSRKSID